MFEDWILFSAAYSAIIHNSIVVIVFIVNFLKNDD